MRNSQKGDFMIYFDNSASSNKKTFMVRYNMFKYSSPKYAANGGRSSHKKSMFLAQKILEAREHFNDFFGNDCVDHTIFTSGCTESANTAIFGTQKKGGHILVTVNEHNSVLRTVEQLKQRGVIEYDIVPCNENQQVTLKEIIPLIKPNTYLLCFNHASNVTGATSPLFDIGEFCKQKGILFMVDGAQSAGHEIIHMVRQNISILNLAGHKGLMGPQGVGAMLFRKDVCICPFKFGGTGVATTDLNPPVVAPDSFEAGTSACPNILAYDAALKYVDTHFLKIQDKISKLTKYLHTELKKLDFIKVLNKDCSTGGIVLFLVDGKEPNEVANYLSDKGVCIRSGLHCAPLIHKHLGTDKTGAVRISLSSYNTLKECKKFMKIIKAIND